MGSKAEGNLGYGWAPVWRWQVADNQVRGPLGREAGFPGTVLARGNMMRPIWTSKEPASRQGDRIMMYTTEHPLGETLRVGIARLVVAIATGFVAFMADAIEVTRQSSQVRGEWLELWSEPEGNIRGEAGLFRYDSSDASMLFWNAASGPHEWARAQGALGPFSLWLTASSDPWGVPAPQGSGGDEAGSVLSVAVESRTRFVASAPTLAFTLQAEAHWNYSAQEQDMGFVLRDLTLDEVLLRWQLTDQPDHVVVSSYRFDVNPAHEYEMVLTGWVEAWDAKDAWMRLWVGWEASGGPLRIARVPDAGSTAALMILGVGGLWALRRVWKSPSR